jgi:hypothetical protein
MSQLVKGIYGSEFDRTGNLFGLLCGQMSGSATKITHNSGWYNKRGEKLGWGDLSAEDFQRISMGIAADELFIILGEQDSHGNFQNKRVTTGILFKKEITEAAPGVEYVAAHAIYVIAKGQLYSLGAVGAWVEERYGLPHKGIAESKVLRKMMRAMTR